MDDWRTLKGGPKGGPTFSAPRLPLKIRSFGTHLRTHLRTHLSVVVGRGMRAKPDPGGKMGILWDILGPRRPRPTHVATKRTARRTARVVRR
jgi:hypothetical protein